MRKPALILASALLAAACSSPADDTPTATETAAAPAVTTPAAQPQTVDAAKAAAQAEFDAYAAGDWQGTWDLWTAEGKAVISRNDYAKYHDTCKTITGLPFEITNARLEGTDTAIVTYKRATFSGKGEMRYEDGAWRWQPDAEDMAGYREGVDKMIADAKAEGGCTG